jgi:hypothetical protein
VGRRQGKKRVQRRERRPPAVVRLGKSGHLEDSDVKKEDPRQKIDPPLPVPFVFLSKQE